MLSKLIKYDIRSTWRDFAAVYMAIILGAIIMPFLFNNIENEIVMAAVGFMTFGLVVAVVVIMIINLFKIFNTNVFSREGYLTMTLPVTSGQIVLSKLIVSTMWIVLTGVISAIGLFILFLIFASNPYTDLTFGIQMLLEKLNGYSITTGILIIFGSIVSAVKEVSKLFLACSIAHLKQLNRFRIPAGIISYFIFSWLETVVVQVVALVASLFSENAEAFINRLNELNQQNDINQFLGLVNGVIGAGIIYALLITAAFSMGTVWILNHKLDLD